jgi:hypothetical protein
MNRANENLPAATLKLCSKVWAGVWPFCAVQVYRGTPNKIATTAAIRSSAKLGLEEERHQ